MEAGRLRHRVTIQSRRPPELRNSTGEVITAWVDVDTVWASIDPVSGLENVDREAWQATVTQKVRIRRRAGVTPDMRVTVGTRIFNIKAVLETNLPTEMVLMCEEVIQ